MNDDYPPTNYKGSGFWKTKLPKPDNKKTPTKEEPKEKPEKPVPCVKKDGFKPWPPCP